MSKSPAPAPVVPPAGDPVAGGNINFTNWKDAAQLQIQFIDSLGQYKLNVAEAELNEANAENQFERARLRAEVIHELTSAMARFRAVRRHLEIEAAQWGEYGKWMSYIQNGEDSNDVAISLMWQGYNVVVRTLGHDNRAKLMATAVPPEAKQGPANFADVRASHRNEACADAPDYVSNVLQLIAWLHSKLYWMPRTGSPAWALVTDAFDTIASTASAEITALNKAVNQIETQTYDTWKPIELASLLSDESVKAIMDAKPSGGGAKGKPAP
jgi:hypothetical protein